MADPLPDSPAPAIDKAFDKTRPFVPPVLVTRRGTSRVWGLIDLLLLVAIAAGAAFYAVRETLWKHQTQLVDRPDGPLAHVRDAAPEAGAPAPIVSTTPAPTGAGTAGDAPVKIESTK